MHVCVITATYPPIKSGGADPIRRFCCLLAGRGNLVDVITSTVACGLEENPRLRVHPVVGPGAWSASGIPKLVATVRGLRPDVVNIQYEGSLYGRSRAVTMLPAFLKMASPRAKVVTNFEYPLGARWLSGAFERRPIPRTVDLVRRRLGWFDPEFGALLSASDKVIVQSEYHRIRVKAALPAVDRKTVIIPWGASTVLWQAGSGNVRDEARSLLGLPPNDLIVCYYGYLYPGKGIENLLLAAASLLSQGYRFRLVIAGGGENVLTTALGRSNYASELASLAEKLGLGELIHWTGFLSTAESLASTYLSAADVCVLPYDEGASLNKTSVATALAHALPLVTTRRPYTDKEFEDGQNVILCPPEDSQALATALRPLLDSSELRARLSDGARELYAKRLAWDVVVQDTMKAFGN